MLGKDGAADGAPRLATAASGLDDARLLADIDGGDLRAFEEIYRRYHARLTRFLKTMLGPPSLVEEVLNDTMMVVWANAGRYTGAR
jgi:DNA-directed RNA polymerase specialized sigma24 family protein